MQVFYLKSHWFSSSGYNNLGSEGDVNCFFFQVGTATSLVWKNALKKDWEFHDNEAGEQVNNLNLTVWVKNLRQRNRAEC